MIEGVATAPAGEVLAIEKRGETSRRRVGGKKLNAREDEGTSEGEEFHGANGGREFRRSGQGTAFAI